MDESITKEISIEGVSSRDLFGTHGAYLERMAALSPRVKIVARGDTVKVLGSKADVEAFERKMRGLLDYYSKYGHISTEVVEQSFAPGLGEHGVDAPAENRGGHSLRQQRPCHSRPHAKPAAPRQDILALRPYVRRGSGRLGQDLHGHSTGRRRPEKKQVRRIILTRPAVEAGEKLGFLPGDMKEKLDPYLQPLYDALNDMIPAARLQKYIEEGTVQIAPLAYMRGRTLDNAFVILDEAQNTTLPQIKMFLTRMGRNAKFIVTGDVTQIDLPRRSDSGLMKAMATLEGIEGIGTVRFDRSDIVRHPLVRHIVDAFERRDKLENSLAEGNDEHKKY